MQATTPPPVYSRLHVNQPLSRQQKKTRNLKIALYTTLGVGGAGLLVTILFVVLYLRAYQAALQKNTTSSSVTGNAMRRATTFKKKKTPIYDEPEDEYYEDDYQDHYNTEQRYIPQFLPLGDDSQQ
jgi:hypothetical protein